MIESIEIRNFKRIGVDGLKLNNLAKVNYLVGKNGSGKSSVLEGIYDYFTGKKVSLEYTKQTHDPHFFKILRILPDTNNHYRNNFQNYTTTDFEGMENSRSIFMCDLKPFVLYLRKKYKGKRSRAYGQNEIEWGIDMPYEYKQDRFTSLRDKENNISQGLSNYQKFNGILEILKFLDINIILIEEPEIAIHPGLQKQLPAIFSDMIDFLEIDKLSSQNYYSNNVNFIITTHSPFIINAAGEQAQSDIEADYPITQKVYMIEDGQCLNPEGSSGKDVKGIAATMLGAGIEDLTPSTVVFCAETEALFLEAINTTLYFRDIKFLTPFNGNDETIRKLEILTDAGMFNDTFYKGATFWYYLDHPNEHQLKSKRYQDLKEKAENQANLLLSDKEMFELKFTDDEEEARRWHKEAKDFAQKKADAIISMGEKGKSEFEEKFPELADLFNFKTKIDTR